jgi:S-DNA-T family DNA segregation ATPase FtsK/SpoIIIE
MARKSKKNPPKRAESPIDPRVKVEILAVGIALVAILSFLSFFGSAGVAGTFINRALSAIFGLTKYVFPFALVALALGLLFPDRIVLKRTTKAGAIVFFLALSGFLNLVKFPNTDAMLFTDNSSTAGGYVGLLLSYPLAVFTGYWAGIAILVASMVVAVFLLLNLSFQGLLQRLAGLRTRASMPGESTPDGTTVPSGEFNARAIPEAENEDDEEGEGEVNVAPVPATMRRHYAKVTVPLDLLENKGGKPTSGDIHGRQVTIRKTLENFGIPVEMGEVSVGPTVTQFTLKPSEGIRLSRLTALSNDLALALAAHPIRIEAPIPGKSLVGIEVPNQTVAVVGMREVLDSGEFKGRKSNLTLCLGKDVAGKPWIADLSRMPHLLVAGATGSGKTVCLNAIIMSLLYQNGPDELKLLLIDPKRVELPAYNGIPHLLAPAITEVPKIINALKWAIGEMDRRFELLKNAGKRDIASYNDSAKERIPYLVIVIDELADLMVSSAAEVESSIIRLAQLARAVGIHLVVATQRPDVTVITGLIKANITSRIAFSVSSQIDSRTILDTPGAEKLVGRGDMLFLTAELGRPKRIQCCYVSDNDVRRVVDFITSALEEPVIYDESVTDRRPGFIGASGAEIDDGDADPLYEDAKDTVVRAGKASASYLQRRLKVGYARAARLLDLLEEGGIIGPGEGAKPRAILVPHAEPVDIDESEDVSI